MCGGSRFGPSSGGELLLLVARAALATATERKSERSSATLNCRRPGRFGASGRRCRRSYDEWDMSDRSRVLLLRNSAQAESRGSSLSVGGTKRRRAGAGLVIDTQRDRRPTAE